MQMLQIKRKSDIHFSIEIKEEKLVLMMTMLLLCQQPNWRPKQSSHKNGIPIIFKYSTRQKQKQTEKNLKKDEIDYQK